MGKRKSGQVREKELRKLLTLNFFKEHYFKLQKTKKQIREEFKISTTAFDRYFKKFKLKTKKLSEIFKGKKFTLKHRKNISRARKGIKIDNRTLRPNYCIDCHCLIYYKSKRCFKCYIKSKSGKKSIFYKNGKSHCVDCGKELYKYKAKRCKVCNGKFFRGNNSVRFGKLAPISKIIVYKCIKFRSPWEANFAKWLDLSGIKWEYEPKTFDLGSTTYTPDFYLPEFDLWIEIKGYFRQMAKKKFNLFLKMFPNINIKLLLQKELKNLGVI